MTEQSAPQWASRWRLTYTPGDWLALAGPNALVVLQPASPQWSELINTIWEDVLAAGTIEDLLGKMAAFRLEQMPSFAAFFWGADGMRSLVRGSVRIIDDATGALLADGDGVQTWSEHGLAGTARVRVEMVPPDHELRLQLPLVVGAASISTLVVETAPQLQVRSAQGWEPHLASLPTDDRAGDQVDDHRDEDIGTGDGEADDAVDPGDFEDRPRTLIEPAPSPAPSPVQASATPPQTSDPEEVPVRASADDALGIDDADARTGEPDDNQPPPSLPQPPVPIPPVSGPLAPSVPVPPVPVPPAPVTAAPAPVAGPPAAGPAGSGRDDTDEDGHTLLAPSLPGQPQVPSRDGAPAARARVVVGVLRPSSGGSVDIDRPIVIGRSPSASRVSSDQLPRLLTVPSPSHDISRTHVQVAPGDGQVLVTDLNSTNGTVVVRPDGSQQTLEPSAPVAVGFGTVIDLGDGVTILVEPPRQ